MAGGGGGGGLAARPPDNAHCRMHAPPPNQRNHTTLSPPLPFPRPCLVLLCAVQEVVRRWGLQLTPQQASVFAALWEWRSRVCRAEDESTGYVLPKAQLVALAQDMPGERPSLG